MKSLAEVLTEKGVDLTGWKLQNATGVSADGTVIVGYGTRSSAPTAFIVNLGDPDDGPTDPGITTPEDLAASLTSGTAPAQQGQRAVTTTLNRSLFAATNTIPVAPPVQLASADPNMDFSISRSPVWSAYAVGSIGTSSGDWSLDGTVGLMAEVSEDLRLGAGIIGGYGDTETYLGGSSRVYAAGGSVLAAYEQPEGLRLYGTAFVAHLSVDTDRHYYNGAGIDGSNGETDGVGYGAAVRGGWAFPVHRDISVMPYVELRWSKTKLDGYTETDGPFPATYSDQKSERTTSHVGLQGDLGVTPDLRVYPRVAWGHQLYSDEGTLTATTIGLTQTLNPGPEDRSWAEGAIAAIWRLSDRMTLSAELAGRTGDTAEPEASLMIGIALQL